MQGNNTSEKIMAGIYDSIKEGANDHNRQHYNVVYEVVESLVVSLDRERQLAAQRLIEMRKYKQIAEKCTEQVGKQNAVK